MYIHCAVSGVVESLASGRAQPEKSYVVKGDLTTQRTLSGVKLSHKHLVRFCMYHMIHHSCYDRLHHVCSLYIICVT